MIAASALAVALGAETASAITATPDSRGADRLLDVRIALGEQAQAAAAPAGLAARSPRQAQRVDAARDALARRLGARGDLRVDPLSGTIESLQRLDGALTSPSGASPAAVARRFAAEQATALGLDAADANALHVDEQVQSPSGLTVVHLGQQVDGIPTFDDGLRVAVDHAGRVLSVGGAPRSDLPPAVDAPRLTAADALARLMDQTGIRRPVTVTGTENDARRMTRFSSGDIARLVLFGARAVHLAWHLSYQADSTHWYDAVVDADTGEVLYRANLVKFAVNASVFRNYPGAPAGGTQVLRDLAPYLNNGATTLTGPYVHAYADTNDNNIADPGEEVTPNNYVASTNAPASGGCDATHLCTWDHTSVTSWTANKNQNVTQTFWYANHFHDHLASAPIGFGPASGNFEGTDALELNALDGAATASGGGPDAAHVDNANMTTPARGRPPRMQMYLFSHGAPHANLFRDINGGDDAAVLYHEYTHGLSGRLVTHSDGTQALNSPHAGAMGEGWSDWYAEDLLVREGLVADSPGVDGNVDVGRYTDAQPHGIRSQAMDCSVGSTNSAACPGGGYTFGKFGKIAGNPEVHADGEIWSQTLWQLRQALVARMGSDSVGSDVAERLITDGMRLSVPEPSFLDMRNAILAADTNAFGGANRALIWSVFAARGMGFFAGANDGSDVQPAEDFAAPPPPGAPTGTIGGTVTSADTGLPLGNADVGIGGLSTDAAFTPNFAATTDDAGHYTMGGVPQGHYPKLRFGSHTGYDAVVRPADVGAALTADVALRRDWAARLGGATIQQTNDDTGAGYGCGTAALIDQAQGAGWSAENHLNDAPATRYAPTAVVALPQAITVDEFQIDPGNTCGDDNTAAAKDYRLETSPDGTTWTTAAQGSFTIADIGRRNSVSPTAGATSVRYVRLTLLSAQDQTPGHDGARFIDMSELWIHGGPPNVLPSGTLSAKPATVAPNETVTFQASFTDPDSAITGYEWDFDGNGTADATTPGPTIEHRFTQPGTAAVRVAADDYRGGTGTAWATVTVTGPTVLSTPLVAPAKVRPSFVLPRTGRNGRVRIKVKCNDPCRLTGSLTIDSATRRRVHLRSRTVARLGPVSVRGTRTLTITVSRSVRSALRRGHVTKPRVGLRLAATVTGGGPRRSVARGIRMTL